MQQVVDTFRQNRKTFMQQTLSTWWSGLGLQRKLQILIQALLIVILLAAQQWLSNRLEARELTTAQERTMAIADGVNNGLNTFMDITLDGKDVISDPKARERFTRKSTRWLRSG